MTSQDVATQVANIQRHKLAGTRSAPEYHADFKTWKETEEPWSTFRIVVKCRHGTNARLIPVKNATAN
jgi:hypothetical protein